MPNIPLYNAPDPEIRVPSLATESYASGARVIGELGRQGAAETEKAFKTAGAAITDFGEKLQQSYDYKDKLNGINGLSEMETRHEKEINGLKSDPNIPSSELPDRLSQTYQQHLGEITAFQDRFGGSSKEVQLWAAGQTREYKKHIQGKFEADQAVTGAVAAADGFKRSVNDIASGMGDTPTPFDLDRGLTVVGEHGRVLAQTPGLTPLERKRITEASEAQQGALAHSKIKTMLDQDPSRWSELRNKFGHYLTPEQQTSLEEHANKVSQAKVSGVIDGLANDFADRFSGRKPATGDGPPALPVPGARRVSYSGGTFVPPEKQVQPGTPSADDPRGMIPVIRAAALANNVDPDRAVLVTSKEGLFRFDGDHDENGKPSSFGAFQLHRGGGMGDDYFRETGKDPADPKNEVDAIYWTMGNIRRFGGWQKFNGSHGVIGQWDGIGSGSGPDTSIAASPPRYPSPVGVGNSAGYDRVTPANTAKVLAPYATGNARPGAASGVEYVHPEFASRIDNMVQAMPPEIREKFEIISGFRSPERNKEVYRQLGKPPSRDSYHSHGVAVDLGDDPDVLNWIDKNGDKFGVGFTIKHLPGEDNHLEPTENGQRIARGNLAQWDQDHSSAKPQDRLYAEQSREGSAQLVADKSGGLSGIPQKPQQKPDMPPFPSREQMRQYYMDRMPKDLTPGLETQYRKEIDTFTEKVHKKLLQETEEERNALGTEILGGFEKLKDGLEYNFDEKTIRHYFEPKTAQKYLDNLNDAKLIGAQIGKIRETPISDIFENIRMFEDQQSKVDPNIFDIHQKMVVAYHAAADRFLKGIGMSPGQNEKADPVKYLTNYDPDLQQKFRADLRNPENAQAFASSILQRQEKLGMPSERQHVLTNPMSQAIVQSIITDPAHASDYISGLRHQWGPAFDHVWFDLVNSGRLPAGFQLMEAIDDPRDKTLLARGLTQEYTSTLKPAPGQTEFRNESMWQNLLGKDYHAIKNTIRADNDSIKPFVKSLMMGASSETQVNSLLGAVDTLAFSKYMFDPETKGDAEASANAAIKSALGHYKFTGTARIPSAVYDAVSENSRNTVQGLNLGNTTVPPGFGGKGEPSADSYLSVHVKANPTWFTTPKEDAIQLIDSAGRIVRDKAGQPITVKFDDPASLPKPPLPPMQMPGLVPQAPL